MIAIEPSSCRNATSVVWLSHGGNLIRGAPEHLRYATDIERAAYESKNGFLNITQDLRRGQGRQFQDPGEPPSTAEGQFAEGGQGEDPMDTDVPEPSGAPMSFGPQPTPSPPARAENRTKRSNRRSAHVGPMDCGPPNSQEKREHPNTPSVSPNEAKRIRTGSQQPSSNRPASSQTSPPPTAAGPVHTGEP